MQNTMIEVFGGDMSAKIKKNENQGAKNEKGGRKNEKIASETGEIVLKSLLFGL